MSKSTCSPVYVCYEGREKGSAQATSHADCLGGVQACHKLTTCYVSQQQSVHIEVLLPVLVAASEPATVFLRLTEAIQAVHMLVILCCRCCCCNICSNSYAVRAALTSCSLQPEQAVVFLLHAVDHVITWQAQNLQSRLQCTGHSSTSRSSRSKCKTGQVDWRCCTASALHDGSCNSVGSATGTSAANAAYRDSQQKEHPQHRISSTTP